MSINPAVLNPGTVLATTTSAVITSAANTQSIVKRAVAANVASGAVTITVTRTPSGGSALTIVPARSISAGATDLLPELTNMTLNPGDAISAFASSAASINFFASGFTQ